MDDIRVLIVEDDFMVAEINKSVTEEVKGFRVIEIAKDGTNALLCLDGNSLDLIILDVYLPDIHGLELLKEIRKREYPVDIILITAAHDAKTVENAIRFGVYDYIIKPFDFDRYKSALLNYKKYRSSIKKDNQYDQEQLNALVAFKDAGTAEEELPKGITHYTLGQIKTAIDGCGPSFTIGDVMVKVSFSKITVRKYLEFLAREGMINKSYQYKKIGRPVTLYSKLE